MKDKILLNEPGILYVCSYGEFEPIIYDNGKGFEGDLLRAIAKLWQVDIKFHREDNYEEIWEMPEKYNYDVAAGGIDPRKERQDNALYSHPTARCSQSLLIRTKDRHSIVGFESFKDGIRKIGVVPSSAGEKFGIERAKEAGISEDVFKQYKSESELLPALLKGEIDAIARGNIGNEYQAERNEELLTIARKDYGEKFCFAVSPKRKEFLKQLNEAIDLITDSGKISYEAWSRDHDVFYKKILDKKHEMT